MHRWTATATPDHRAAGAAPTLADAWDSAHLAAQQLARAGGRFPVMLCVEDVEAKLNGPATMSGEEIAAWIELDREEIVDAYRDNG